MPDEPGSVTESSVTVQTEIVHSDNRKNFLCLAPGEDFDVIPHLSGAAKLLSQVVTRQVEKDIENNVNFNEISSDTDPIIEVLERLITSFRNGTSTQDISTEIEKLILAREERSDLVNHLLVAHDVDRLPGYLKLRKRVESYLLRAATNGDLSPTEALAFLKMSQTEIEGITSQVRSGAHAVKDVQGLIDKADFVNKASEMQLMEKFKDTSPQAREILRKIGHRISKAAKG